MGRRYQSILKYLDIPFKGVDAGDAVPSLDYKGVLIATPTPTHVDLIEQYNHIGLPILCEKPISKNWEDLKRVIKLGDGVTMVNQYEYLARGKFGETFYNYWNSGKDGAGWDCINIIGLAKDTPARISNKSPIWQCTINGHEINIKHMDQAYCRMIDDWVKHPRVGNMEYIEKAHSRVLENMYIYDE